MPTTALVGVEEYLHSIFEPDAEYLEGRIVPRSMPPKPHSEMQGDVYRSLYEVARPIGYKIWLEQRVRTQANPPHYRVPDICVTFGEPDEDIFTVPPFLCVEILSPGDTVVDVRAKVREYRVFGVPYIWIVEPQTGAGEARTPDGIERVENGRFQASEIVIQLERP